MDEYERIEEELSQVYATYVVKIRCLAYLEEQLEELEKAQKIEFAVSSPRIPPRKNGAKFVDIVQILLTGPSHRFEDLFAIGTRHLVITLMNLSQERIIFLMDRLLRLRELKCGRVCRNV